MAGQLTLGELRRVEADVVGVRSAVCRGGDRDAGLRTELVAAAVAELRAGGPAQPGMIRVPAEDEARWFPDDDGHPGAAHRLGQVGVDGPSAAGVLQRLQLAGPSAAAAAGRPTATAPSRRRPA